MLLGRRGALFFAFAFKGNARRRTELFRVGPSVRYRPLGDDCLKERFKTFQRLMACCILGLVAGCAGSGAQMSALPLADAPLGEASVSLCPAFANGAYTQVVTNAPVDRNSAAYISSVIQAGDRAGFFASTGVEQVNLANDATPLRTVKPRVEYHKFPKPYPWSKDFYIEPLGDRHAMVVQTRSCHLFESYETEFQAPTLSAFSGANWDLAKSFVPLAPGTPSAMASGLSLFAGIVRWEDYKSGSIDHALNWDGIRGTVAQHDFVRPASDTDRIPFQGKSSYAMPYGVHLRLKATFSTQGWGAQATMVANAMKTYGIYLADTGSGRNALYFANAPDGSNPWNRRDLSSLSSITMHDFDVLKLGKILKVP
jgi:hypothetical protein